MGPMAKSARSLPGTAPDPKSSSCSPDQLEYIADMLVELEAMAIAGNCETLARLIALSGAEARRRADKLRQ